MNFLIPSNLLKGETEKAVYIKIPKKNSGFWVSKKLIRPYKNSYSLYAGEDYTFKNGEIGVYELSEMFSEIKPLFATHKPKPLVAEPATALDELKDE